MHGCTVYSAQIVVVVSPIRSEMLVITVTIDDACIGAFAAQVRVSSVMIARFVLREIHGDESDLHDHFYSRYSTSR